MISIRRKLLLSLVGGVLAATLLAILAVYYTVREEANELFDTELRHIAATLPSEMTPQAETAENAEDDIVIQIWNANGSLIYGSRPIQTLPRAQEGFSVVTAHNASWRTYLEADSGRYIQVAQATAARDELVLRSAMRAVIPFIVLIPILALVITIAVAQGLKPLRVVAAAVERRSPTAMQPLPANDTAPELRPMITAINSLLRRLDSALAAQRASVANAAHELRSPLTALKLQVQLAERAGSDEQRAAAFTKLEARLERAIHLVQQLLTLARHEAQVAEQEVVPLALSSIVRQVIADNESFAANRDIDLQSEIATPQVVMGHYDSLCILLRNLVDNALRYTPHGGHIVVSVFGAEGRVFLTVTDDGPGISAAERERVFDRFYRSEGTAQPGSGLGLAIVKSIAEQHNAVISLDDNPLGHGLVVSVSFSATLVDQSSHRRSITMESIPTERPLLRIQHPFMTELKLSGANFADSKCGSPDHWMLRGLRPAIGIDILRSGE